MGAGSAAQHAGAAMTVFFLCHNDSGSLVMSWCVLTVWTQASIDIAIGLRRQHMPRSSWRGKRCRECQSRWGRYGCCPYLWATDYLSSLSRILVPDRPERPKPGRHRSGYTTRLTKQQEKVRAQLATTPATQLDAADKPPVRTRPEVPAEAKRAAQDGARRAGNAAVHVDVPARGDRDIAAGAAKVESTVGARAPARAQPLADRRRYDDAGPAAVGAQARMSVTSAAHVAPDSRDATHIRGNTRHEPKQRTHVGRTVAPGMREPRGNQAPVRGRGVETAERRPIRDTARGAQAADTAGRDTGRLAGAVEVGHRPAQAPIGNCPTRPGGAEADKRDVDRPRRPMSFMEVERFLQREAALAARSWEEADTEPGRAKRAPARLRTAADRQARAQGPRRRAAMSGISNQPPAVNSKNATPTALDKEATKMDSNALPMLTLCGTSKTRGVETQESPASGQDNRRSFSNEASRGGWTRPNEPTGRTEPTGLAESTALAEPTAGGNTAKADDHEIRTSRGVAAGVDEVALAWRRTHTSPREDADAKSRSRTGWPTRMATTHTATNPRVGAHHDAGTAAKPGGVTGDAGDPRFVARGNDAGACLAGADVAGTVPPSGGVSTVGGARDRRQSYPRQAASPAPLPVQRPQPTNGAVAWYLNP